MASALILLSCALAGCGAAPDGSPAGTSEGALPPDPAGVDPSGDAGPSGMLGAGDGAASSGTPDAAPLPDAGPAPEAGPAHDAGPSNPCPALTFPSGVKIQTFEDAATTATYANHLGSGESAPKCFLDADHLVNPDTGEVYATSVQVATDFQLVELVGTELSQGYGHFVLATPSAVEALQKFRDSVGGPVSVISGFRSPKHQEDVCNGLCGNPLGCPGTCANNSRHMFGDAFDLPMQFYTPQDEDYACADGFKFAYLESGTHLHVDQNPDYATCVKE